jgi:3-oxo-5alpha-steroid 4-dehydrogenase
MSSNEARTPEKGLSRRQFLGHVAVGAAAVSGATLVGGVSNALAKDVGVTWDKQADVVVMGFGAAGAAGAIEARAAGASTIVLEQTAAGGGATKLSGGLMYMGGGTPLQKKLGVTDTRDDMYNYLMAALGAGASEEHIALFCDKSPELYDWVSGLGTTFPEKLDTGHLVTAPPDVGLIYSGNERGSDYTAVAKAAPRGHSPSGGSGGAIWAPLEAAVVKSGAEIVYSAEAQSLIQDASGRVIGVKALIGGSSVSIQAKRGVLLAAGAYTLNTAMVAAACPDGVVKGSNTAAPTDKGTGIIMGQRIGAATRGMSQCMLYQALYMVSETFPTGILVDSRGMRMIAEDAYGSWIGRAVKEQSPAGAYVILDETTRKKAKLPSWLPAVASKPSIKALAGALKISSHVLSATVQDYNSMAAKHQDPEFNKAKEYLVPQVKPPFHAYYFGPSMASFMALGGLKINTKSQVLSVDDQPIVGLYAAGRTGCAVFGGYPGSGTSIAESLTFGRIAGQQLAALARWTS